jgi:hypothetical protein
MGCDCSSITSAGIHCAPLGIVAVLSGKEQAAGNQLHYLPYSVKYNTPTLTMDAEV